MAALVAHDVVKEAQSVGAQSPTGEIATSTESAPAVRASQVESQALSVEATADTLNHSNGDREAPEDTAINGPSRDLSRSPYSKEALADASGGSDTDTSKTDGVTSKEDAAGHIRTNSFKKPISFKSVSVTKNFLAKANVPQVSIRAGDKGVLNSQSATAGSTLKPRLVAKSALGGLSSRSTLGGNAGALNSPDASKVWNKNRPPPPPVPRNYTDEELKQQYGIHMATRLGADDDGKEAKWADIDDDEDDWAPETVTWLDGTKSTVAPTDIKPAEIERATPPQAVKPLARADNAKPGERPRLQLQKQSRPPQASQVPQVSQAPQPLQPPETPVVETILSEAPHPSTPVLASTKTILKPGSHALAQKTASNSAKSADKQLPVATGSPAPVPVKSPWAALPPIDKASPVTFVPPPQPHRFSKDPSGFEGFQHATPLSPQEIEADDFHRFHNQPRRKELFNSQSGEFEPANDARRNAGRSEAQNARQPAVLQRGGHGQPSPAEPSAGFSSQRAGQDGAPWQRQRAGSNSSASRRLSSSKLQDYAGTKQDALAEHPADAETVADPVETADNSQPANPQANMTNGQPEPDAAAYMRETLEKAKLAKQLRLQEEQQEEQARKERLRLKMAALAPPVSPSPTNDPERPKSAASSAVKSPHLAKAAQVVASPPKPPVPTAKGEVAQYGLMKVHQSQPVKAAAASENPVNRHGGDVRLPRRQVQNSEAPPQRSDTVTKPTNASHDTHAQSKDHARSNSAVGTESSPWRTSATLPEGINGWANSSSSNVWGPPQSKAKALGNGTFDNSGFRTLQSGATAPGPIAPPTGPATSHAAGRSVPTHVDRAHGPHGEVSPPNSLGHGDAQKFMHSPHRQYSQLPRADHAQHDKQLHSSGGPVRQPQVMHETSKAHAVASGWNALVGSTLEDNQQARREWQQQQSDRPITPIYGKAGPMDVRRTMLGSEGQHNRVDFSSDKLPNGNIVLPGHLGASPQAVSATRTPLGPNAVAQARDGQSQRPSRFFPRNEPIEQSEKSNSPPPPEISSLDGGPEVYSARVNIPKLAIVKLPPPSALPSPAHLREGSLPLSPTLVGTTLNGDWQSKFKTLFKSTSPAVDAVTSSSRAPLDSSSFHGSAAAAVSLPMRGKAISRPLFAVDRSPQPQSRGLDDELYPQPEFGSTPTIKFPKRAHKQQPASQTPYKVFHPLVLQAIRQMEIDFVLSRPIWEQHEQATSSRGGYIVRLSKDALPKHVSASTNAARSTYGRSGFKDRRQYQEFRSQVRGARRNGTPHAARENHTGSLRGNPHRTSHRAGSGFVPKRNITAPAVAQ